MFIQNQRISISRKTKTKCPCLSEPGTQYLWKYLNLSKICFTHLSSRPWGPATDEMGQCDNQVSQWVGGRTGRVGYRHLMSNFSESRLTRKPHLVFSVILLIGGQVGWREVGLRLNLGKILILWVSPASYTQNQWTSAYKMFASH